VWAGYFAYIYVKSATGSVSRRLATGEEAVGNSWKESDVFVNITATGQPKRKRRSS
jgi:hypothetical protein